MMGTYAEITAWELMVACGNVLVTADNLSSGDGRKITVISHFLKHEIS